MPQPGYKHRKKRAYFKDEETLINSLVAFYSQKQRFPKLIVNKIHWCDEDLELCNELNIPSVVTIIRYCGSYRKVMEKAAATIGIEYRQRRSYSVKKYSDEYLLNALNSVYNNFCEYPAQSGKGKWHKRFHEVKLPSPGVYQKRFGSYTAAKEKAKELLNDNAG
jgi:hypothetical protein